jgi:hypothetical protein
MPARDNVAGPLGGTASPADDNRGVGNHSWIIGRHRRWLLTAYPSRLTRVSQPRWLLTAYPSGLTRVSQPPDPCLAWGQTPQFRQWSQADDSQPEGLCPTVLTPLDRPILSMIGTGKFRRLVALLDRPILSMIGNGEFRRLGFCGQTLRA